MNKELRIKRIQDIFKSIEQMMADDSDFVLPVEQMLKDFLLDYDLGYDE